MLSSLGYAFLSSFGLVSYFWWILLTSSLTIFFWRSRKVGFVGAIFLAALFFTLKEEKFFVFVFGSLLPALILSLGLRLKKSPTFGILLALIPNLVVLALVALHYSEVVFVLKFQLHQIVKQIVGGARLFGISSFFLERKTLFLGDFLAELFFGLELVSALVGIFLVYSLVQLIGVRLGWDIPKIAPFHLWRGSHILAWSLILGLVLFLVGGKLFEMVSKNILLVIGFCYSVLGFSAAEWFLREFKLGWWSRILFYGLVFVTQVFSFVLLFFLGFFDSWLDFRRLSAKSVAKCEISG